MKLSILVSAAITARLVSGHAYVWGISINGNDMGRGDQAGYIRKVHNNDPIKDVKSQDMTCNKNNGPARTSMNIKGGDKVTIEWAHNNRGDDIIAGSHKGPVQVFLAENKGNLKGPVFTKVASEAFTGGQWATDKLIRNKGKHSFTFPHVPAGEYIIRPEIVALHEGNRQGGAQLYMACIQVKVASGSGAKLPGGLSFPGSYSANDPGILFNVYDKPMKRYIAPGGALKSLSR